MQAILKNILFLLMDGRRHVTNKRSAHEFFRLKIVFHVFLEFLFSMSSVKHAQRGASLLGEAGTFLCIYYSEKKQHSNVEERP